MVRSRAIIAVVVVLVVGMLVAKATLSRNQRAGAISKYATPGEVVPATETGPVEKGAELTGADLAKSLRSGRPTVADFGEGWCTECKKMVPVLAAATKKYRGQANVVFVDTKAFPELADTYHVTRIPTQIFFTAKGKEVTRHIGYYPPEEVAKDLAKAGVAAPAPAGARGSV